MKYINHVAIMEFDGTMSYVTGVNYINKSALWTAGQPAKKFTKSAAEDLVFGLVCNGFKACIVRVPDFMEIVNIVREEN